MPGLDGAIESAMGGMLLAQQASLTPPSPRRTTVKDTSQQQQTFGLSRPIMQGIRARVGFLRKRAETAPARIETPVSASSSNSSGARFIAGDVGGLHGPVRLIEPLALNSAAGWRRSVVGSYC